MENPIKQFDPGDIRNLLGVTEGSTHSDVFSLFSRLATKRDDDHKKGFTIYVNESDGNSGVYNKGPNDSNFVLTRIIIKDRVVDDTLTGRYDFYGKQLSIEINRGLGDPMITCRVYLDGSLISSRSSPYSTVDQQVDRILAVKVKSEKGTINHLQKAIEADNSPYPFAMKMLRDFERSSVDQETTQSMFEKLSRKDRVTWNSD